MKLSSQLTRSLHTIYSAFGLGAEVIDKNLYSYFSIQSVNPPEWAMGIFQSIYEEIYSLTAPASDNEYCYYEDSNFRLSWCAITNGENRETTVVLIGPFKTYQSTPEFLSEIITLNSLPGYYRFELENMYRNINEIRIPIHTLADILVKMVRSSIENVQIRSQLHPLPMSNQPASSSEESLGRSFALIQEQYKTEIQYRKAISKGEADLAVQLLKKFPMTFDYRMPKDQLRLNKNLQVVTNTMARLAAYDGGCDPVTLHTLSETLSDQIEYSKSIAELYNVEIEITKAYCDAVLHAKTLHYSPLVKDVVRYIDLHYSENINLQKISDFFAYSRSHVEKKFREETEMSVVEYINLVRINEAKSLLEIGDLSITEISLKVGFNNYSHFSTVFKKLTGLTCSQYVAQRHEESK